MTYNIITQQSIMYDISSFKSSATFRARAKGPSARPQALGSTKSGRDSLNCRVNVASPVIAIAKPWL